jgi:hypothetical protein
MKEISFETILNYFEKHGLPMYQILQREDKTVLISNWNRVPQAMQDYLENFYQLGWEDTSTSCSDCGYHIDLSPSYHGSPDYFYTEYDVICQECFEANPESYLDTFTHIAGNTAAEPKAVYTWMKKAFIKAGFVPFNSESSLCKDAYESGLHYGQNDTPEAVSKRVFEELGPVEMIFFIDSANPFSVYWSVYVRRVE